MKIIFGVAAIGLTTMVAIPFFRCGTLENKLNHLKFEEKTIYLILRGTDSKSGIIANKYNNFDKNVSHIGIAVFEDNRLEIFHISDEMSKRGDNLFQETIEEFTHRDDLLCLEIWKIENMNVHQYCAIKSCLQNTLSKSQNFDREILLNNDSYYCSEYVNDIFAQNNLLLFKKNKILLDGIPKLYLKRDTLEYYPVDGFMQNRNVKKIFEWKKNLLHIH